MLQNMADMRYLKTTGKMEEIVSPFLPRTPSPGRKRRSIKKIKKNKKLLDLKEIVSRPVCKTPSMLEVDKMASYSKVE